MGSPDLVGKLEAELKLLETWDLQDIRGRTMGNASSSVDAKIGGKIDKLLADLPLFRRYASEVSDDALRKLAGALASINSFFKEIQSAADIQRFQQLLEAFEHSYEDILAARSEFLTLRLADDTNIDDLRAAREEFSKKQHEVDFFLEKVKATTGQAAEEVRDVAKGTSLKYAQDIFKDEKGAYDQKTKFWAKFVGGFIVIFLLVLYFFVFRYQPPEAPVGHLDITRLAIEVVSRVTALTLLAGLIAFGFKMVRVNTHLRNANGHRMALAATMLAFANSVSEERREAVLVQLVNAIASYGDDGLIEKGGSDMVYAPQMIVDKILSAGVKKLS